MGQFGSLKDAEVTRPVINPDLRYPGFGKSLASPMSAFQATHRRPYAALIGIILAAPANTEVGSAIVEPIPIFMVNVLADWSCRDKTMKLDLPTIYGGHSVSPAISTANHSPCHRRHTIEVHENLGARRVEQANAQGALQISERISWSGTTPSLAAESLRARATLALRRDLSLREISW